MGKIGPLLSEVLGLSESGLSENQFWAFFVFNLDQNEEYFEDHFDVVCSVDRQSETSS